MISEEDIPVEEISDEEFLEEETPMYEHYRFVVDKGQSLLRIDKYVTEKMERTSRHRIQLAIDAQYVRVNERVV